MAKPLPHTSFFEKAMAEAKKKAKVAAPFTGFAFVGTTGSKIISGPA